MRSMKSPQGGERRNVLTPEALAMMDVIARFGSFAAAARELGKVPSALTYSVRQLEDALDVLLFDRSSRQARLTAAGEELLREGRRLLTEMDAVANRVRRVATGWETQLAIAFETILAPSALFELVEAFYAAKAGTAEVQALRDLYAYLLTEAQPSWEIEDHRGRVPVSVTGMLRFPVATALRLVAEWLATLIPKPTAADEVLPEGPVRDEVNAALRRAKKRKPDGE